MTLTYVPAGVCDHSDSMGSAGRYGDGDMQVMMAGAGCVHGENFPLVHADKPNPLRLFQVWLNLARKDKFAPPGYVMHWAENVKSVEGTGGAVARVVLGRLGDVDSGCPMQPQSWAADPAHDVGLFFVKLPPGGSRFTLPAAHAGAAAHRFAYLTEGAGLKVAGVRVPAQHHVSLRGDADVDLVNVHDSQAAEVLVLQGVPIGEPVVSRGPFVGNTDADIAAAHADYRRTGFGGWPWAEDAVVFPRSQGRFATFVDNGVKRTEYPPNADKGNGTAAGAGAAASAAAGAGSGAAPAREL
jgi:redox-sensitive bicupin YhaK (pirin superfamily)